MLAGRKKITIFANVIELERHIEILLLSNDCVIVPDFGGFMAHHVDARYDGRDNMFLPPLRTIGFNPQLTMNDSLLALSYVEAYDISYPDALSRIAEDVREIRAELDINGKYELTDIGTLYLNSQGTYTFKPCEAGLLTPNYYGLDGFVMQPLAELGASASNEEAAASAEIIPFDSNSNQQVEENKSSRQAATDTVSLNEQEEEEESSEFVQIRKSWLRNAVAACIALIAFFTLSTPLDTPQVQKSKVDISMLNRLMPKEMVKDNSIKALEAVASEVEKKTEIAGNAESTDKAEIEKQEIAKPHYCIVLASRVTKRNAATYTESLQAKGFKDTRVLITSNNVKVVYGSYETEQQAYTALNQLHHHEAFADGWITLVKE